MGVHLTRYICKVPIYTHVNIVISELLLVLARCKHEPEGRLPIAQITKRCALVVVTGMWRQLLVGAAEPASYTCYTCLQADLAIAAMSNEVVLRWGRVSLSKGYCC